MYAKIFDQIYSSSIAEDYQVRHVFMDLLVLADQTGVVDMTVEAVARRTNVPIKILRKALLTLLTPDPHSRSKEEDGRRIVPIDEERDWGWKIVNFEGYHRIQNEDARREYMKAYMRKRREKKQAVNTPVNTCKQPLAELAHVDVDVDTDTNIKNKPLSADADAFDVFWKAYPGKKGGGKAKLRAKWKKDKLDAKADHVMDVLAAEKTSKQWTEDGGRYIPLMSTWLNQQRWDCDITDIQAKPARKERVHVDEQGNSVF